MSSLESTRQYDKTKELLSFIADLETCKQCGAETIQVPKKGLWICIACGLCSCGGCANACTDCYNSGWQEPPELDFLYTWDSIYKNWHENPWVWVYEFERRT